MIKKSNSPIVEVFTYYPLGKRATYSIIAYCGKVPGRKMGVALLRYFRKLWYLTIAKLLQYYCAIVQYFSPIAVLHIAIVQYLSTIAIALCNTQKNYWL